ncbi:FadR/GntR family transcriptional regulator [Granulosicoccus antarcticus]|uniref:HTH-type transcriptional regulator LutR n=1 Tax=Granulosicoccus antarcticus IMCC3135 TaxID=1192854 RepID=A0A2Z2NLH8_9GAMM|nr:FadR/GntR family transcriptional regulator [Granulosicoccus antarcticus]ASJ72009.1 HTH-type transcriptional regulator LutR [Granulosicoccus antarcticus IMCC3135]
MKPASSIVLSKAEPDERRYVQIARDLAKRIAEGEYGAGQRLPPERELASTLSVSRTTVREAVLALELMGLVEIRVGSGVFVLGDNVRQHATNTTPAADETSPSEILESRRLIEAQTAFLAATRASDAQILQIGRCIETMESTLDDVPHFDRADAEFHHLIAKASGNRLLEQFVGHLWQQRNTTMWIRWYDQTRSTANRRRSISDHRVIHRALERRLPEAASTAMQGHIDVMEERFFDLQL